MVPLDMAARFLVLHILQLQRESILAPLSLAHTLPFLHCVVVEVSFFNYSLILINFLHVIYVNANTVSCKIHDIKQI